MPKTLLDLINDAAATDDLTFTGPDGIAVKLADIRGFRSSIETEKQTLQQKQQEATRVAKEAEKMLKDLEQVMREQAAKEGHKEEPKTADWRKNPLYEELVPVLSTLEQEAKEARSQAATAKKALDQISAFYSIERMRSEYDRAPESFRKKVPFEKVVADALANGDVEVYGQGEHAVRMPTLSKRIKEGTEQDRMEEFAKTKVEAAKAEWEKAQKAANIPKPGRFQTRKASESPIKRIEDLTSEVVAGDPEIQAAMEGPIQ